MLLIQSSKVFMYDAFDFNNYWTDWVLPLMEV